MPTYSDGLPLQLRSIGFFACSFKSLNNHEANHASLLVSLALTCLSRGVNMCWDDDIDSQMILKDVLKVVMVWYNYGIFIALP
jgi:hypothetical protein